MGAHDFEELKHHIGHKIEVSQYVNCEHDIIVNVAVECMDCNEVLFDYDNPNMKTHGITERM